MDIKDVYDIKAGRGVDWELRRVKFGEARSSKKSQGAVR